MNKFPDCRTHASRPSCLGWVVWLLLITPQQGWAAGTPAGTTISNVATVGYSIGVVPQPDIPSAAVTFLVDEKINLTVAGGVTTSVASPSAAQATTFTVTNNANSPLDFSLAITDVIAGDQFDPVALSCSAFVESNAVPDGYQAGTDIATFINELPADTTQTVYAVCDIPTPLILGDTGIVGLTATARGDFNATGYVASAVALGAPIIATVGADTVNMDIVFADVAGTEDLPRDAAHSDRNTYVIANAALAITKTAASVLDPNGTAVLMPGAVITYQIAVAVTGAGTISSIVITDPLPAETTYVPGSIAVTCISGTYTGGGACGTGGPITPQPAVAKTDTNLDADFTDFNFTTANTVTVSLGNVAAPANFVITFRATIN